MCTQNDYYGVILPPVVSIFLVSPCLNQVIPATLMTICLIISVNQSFKKLVSKIAITQGGGAEPEKAGDALRP